MAKAQPGSIDFSFRTNFDFRNSDAIIYTTAIQPDGKILIGGKFTVSHLSGVDTKSMLRLNQNGDLDTTFKITSGFDKMVNTICVQPDGKILVTGIFNFYNDISCKKIIRLTANGKIDSTFNIDTYPEYIDDLKLIANNRILVAGRDSKPTKRLMCYNPSGSLDSTFKLNEIDGSVHTIAIQSKDKIFIGGGFSSVNNFNCNSISCLKDNGSLDTTFKISPKIGIRGGVINLIIQQDGKILLGGYFSLLSQPKIINIIRFNQDGSLDSNFLPGTKFDKVSGSIVTSIYLQKDGKILVGGAFNMFTNHKNIVRLNVDGTCDTTFQSGNGFDEQVSIICKQLDNKIIVVGRFKEYSFNPTNRIVRLSNDDSYKQFFKISPNPSIGILKISSSQSLKLITITDAVGKEILRTEPMAFDTQIDLIDKSPGVYFVTVFSDGGSKCQKILKR
jgi:uncharacterized delta-60 repeat protein